MYNKFAESRPNPVISSKFEMHVRSLISDLQCSSRNVKCDNVFSGSYCYFCREIKEGNMMTIIENDNRTDISGIIRISVHSDCYFSLMKGADVSDLGKKAALH